LHLSPRREHIIFLSATYVAPEDKAFALTIGVTRFVEKPVDLETFLPMIEPLAKGELQEASSLLERASQRGNPTAALLRLLGIVQLQLGRDQGLDSIKRALNLNPADLTTIKTYLSALAQFNRRPEALTLARESQMFAQRDPEFLSAWLALESDAGNRAFAAERREQVYARNAADLNNGLALADLYIDTKSWDKARALLDKLRTGNGDKLSAAKAALAGLAADDTSADKARALIGELRTGKAKNVAQPLEFRPLV
jgi:hypothetical protein